MNKIDEIKQAIQDYREGRTANFSNKQFIQWLSYLIAENERLNRVVQAHDAMHYQTCPRCEIDWSEDEVAEMLDNNHVGCICGYEQALGGAKHE